MHFSETFKVHGILMDDVSLLMWCCQIPNNGLPSLHCMRYISPPLAGGLIDVRNGGDVKLLWSVPAL